MFYYRLMKEASKLNLKDFELDSLHSSMLDMPINQMIFTHKESNWFHTVCEKKQGANRCEHPLGALEDSMLSADSMDRLVHQVARAPALKS
jgi:hypothetical protein